MPPLHGPIAEGNVGGGTGMICHEFKGGTGTASRIVQAAGEHLHGRRTGAGELRRTRICCASTACRSGARSASRLCRRREARRRDAGSIIVILATDAPLLPIQCQRLARRATTGLAWVGGVGFNSSGDIFLAFATGNHVHHGEAIATARMLSPDAISPLFQAAAEATEEAILNALTAAETMVGVQGRTAHALPHDLLTNVMHRYRPAK